MNKDSNFNNGTDQKQPDDSWLPRTTEQALERILFPMYQRDPQIYIDGAASLVRLMKIAQRDTGQSRRVAAFLLGLYNGARFRFDLTDLRGLDIDIFDDCMRVLQMDFVPRQEVHDYFLFGDHVFEQLANDWGYRQEIKAPNPSSVSDLTF